MKTKTLVPFLALSFGLTWGIAALLILFHDQVVALYHFQMMNPAFPDAQPWDILIFIIAAVVIVWLNRRKMFQGGEGITDVLMPEEKR